MICPGPTPMLTCSRLKLLLLLSLLATPASSQQVFVQLASRDTISARLRLAVSSNSERKEILMQQFAAAGCKQAFEQPVKGSRQGNVTCILQGTNDETILVGAHFDAINGLGVVDNWSGAAMLPSLYQALAGRERNHTFVFVGFTDEEVGLRGSDSYVKQMNEVQRSQMRAMVNMDCLGMTSTKVWAQRSDKLLLDALSKVASSLKIPVEGVNVGKVGDTDSLSFASKSIPVIDFHSITQTNYERLHMGRDTLDTIRMNDYYDTYKLICIYLGFLDITQGQDTAKAAR